MQRRTFLVAISYALHLRSASVRAFREPVLGALLLGASACEQATPAPAQPPPVVDAAVVGLVRGDALVCSGTLIGARLVLTAAHCFGRVQPTHVRALAANDSDTSVAIADYETHPEAIGSDSNHDVALALLQTAMELPPARLPAASELRPGDALSFVRSGHSGQRGSMQISAVGQLRFVADAAPEAPCSADSGGAGIVRGQLVGVISRGDIGCRSHTEFVRVDAYRAFIAATRASWNL